jgi:hypothetical protein
MALGNKPWDDAERERFRKLWADGVAVNEIGRLLGRSGSSVTGMRDRMGLPERGSPIGRVAENPKGTANRPNGRARVPMVAGSTLPSLASLED